MYDDDEIIVVNIFDIQKLARKHYGTELTGRELESLERIFNTDLSKVDDGGWEGLVSKLVQVVLMAIGCIIEDHRHTRVL